MSLNISLFSTRENLNSTSKYCYYLRGRTRLWRRRWAWNTSLSMDTSEYTFRHISVRRTPAESRQEYMTSNKEYIEPCKTQDQALSLCSGSTESKILGYQGTNPREYQIVSFVEVLAIWFSLGLVLRLSRVLDSVLPLQRLRAWSWALHGSIYSLPLVMYSCPLSAGILHTLLCLKVHSWCCSS